MKITLIGATGFIGSKTLEETLNKGYQVTAVLRDPSKLKVEHPNLKKSKEIFLTRMDWQKSFPVQMLFWILITLVGQTPIFEKI